MAVPDKSGFMEVAQLSFFETGRTDAPAVLFLHGFMGSHVDWLPTMQDLRYGFRCLAPDLPGHGHTAGRPTEVSYSVEHTAERLSLFIQARSASPCTVVGYSMGGRIALRLALDFPESVSRLVLVSSSPGLKGGTEREERVSLDKNRAAAIERDFYGFLENWYNQELFTGGRSTIPWLRRILTSRSKNRASELARSLREAGSGTQIPMWNRLHELGMPVSILVGSLDKKYIDIGKQMVERCRIGNLVVIKDAAHAVHLDQPEAFLSFLKNELLTT